MKITAQGTPIVNVYGVLLRGRDLMILEVDLHSKYCEVGATMSGDETHGPGIAISATRHSLHLSEEHKKKEPTFIEFPEFKGWNVWSATIARYTLAVSLYRIKALEARIKSYSLPGARRKGRGEETSSMGTSKAA